MERARMIKRSYLKSIGLTDEQTTLLMDAQKKESDYRRLMARAGVSANLIETVMKVVDITEEDISDEDLALEQIRAEWSDMIPKNKRK